MNKHLTTIVSVATLVLIAFLSVQVNTAHAASWYNASWGYRTKITIDHNQIASTTGLLATNFPVLVSTTTTALKYTGYANGHVGKTNGGDILFTSSDGITKLNHEIESYVSSSGNLIAWVQVPSLATSTDTVFYMYYGNAGAADQQSVNNTWNDGGSNYFQGVWHLPDGSSLSVADSAANNASSNNGATPTTGQIGGGANFLASSVQSIESGTEFTSLTSAATISAWINPGTSQGQYADAWGDHQGDAKGVVLQQDSNLLNTYYFCYGNGTGFTCTGDFNIPASTWTHVVVTKDANYCHVYLNGAEYVPAKAPCVANIVPANIIFFTLGLGFSGGGRYWNGAEDEVRVSSIDRSSDWVTDEYNNQVSPSTFMTGAAEEAYSAPGSPSTSGAIRFVMSFKKFVVKVGSRLIIK